MDQGTGLTAVSLFGLVLARFIGCAMALKVLSHLPSLALTSCDRSISQTKIQRDDFLEDLLHYRHAGEDLYTSPLPKKLLTSGFLQHLNICIIYISNTNSCFPAASNSDRFILQEVSVIASPVQKL
jgi:hypothetical protein